MDQFLAGQREEGVTDSTGAFTIDGRKARAKMAHQLADPGAYILKLVQAAVAVESPVITVRISRLSLTLEFSAPSTELDSAGEVANSLGRLATLERGPLRHLAVGLNAAFGPSVEQVLWETPSGGLELSEGSLALVPSSSSAFRFTIRKKRPIFPWFRGSFYLDELDCLSQRGTYVPSRLILDGREIYRPVWNRFGYAFSHPQSDEPSFPLEYRVDGEIAFWLAYPSGRWFVPRSRSRQVWNQDRKSAMIPSGAAVPHVIDGWDGQARIQAARALVGLPHNTGGRGRIIPIFDGVRMEPLVDLDLGYPGAQVVLDASHLGTDLTEFALVKDAGYTELIESARHFVSEAVNQLTN